MRWKNSPEEIVWYLRYVSIDGIPLDKHMLAKIMLCSVTSIEHWKAHVHRRGEKFRNGSERTDPPARSIRLIRLEFGIEEPLCKI